MSQACGSNGRPVGEINGLASGIREGGKVMYLLHSNLPALYNTNDRSQSLFFANYDAVTGIFMEPFRGGKKEVTRCTSYSVFMRNCSHTVSHQGVSGVVKGSLRASEQFTRRPFMC